MDPFEQPQEDNGILATAGLDSAPPAPKQLQPSVADSGSSLLDAAGLPSAEESLRLPKGGAAFADQIPGELLKMPKALRAEYVAKLSGDIQEGLKWMGESPEKAAEIAAVMRRFNLPADKAKEQLPEIKASEESIKIAKELLATDEKGEPLYPALAKLAADPSHLIGDNERRKALMEIEESVRQSKQADEGFLTQQARGIVNALFSLLDTGVSSYHAVAAARADAYWQQILDNLPAGIDPQVRDELIKIKDEALNQSIEIRNARSEIAESMLGGFSPEKAANFFKPQAGESPTELISKGFYTEGAYQFVNQGLQSLYDWAAASVAAAGNPTGAMALLSAKSAFGAFDEAQRDGASKENAIVRAGGHGLLEYVFEKLGTLGIIKEASSVKKLTPKSMLGLASRSYATEAVSEGATSAFQNLVTIATDGNMGLREFLFSISDSALAGGFSGAAMSTIISTASYGLNYKKIHNAENKLAQHDGLAEKIKFVAAKNADPQATQSAVETILNEHQVSDEVFVPASKVRNLFQTDEQYVEFMGKLGVSEQQAIDALTNEAASELKVKYSAYLAHSATVSNIESIKADLRFGENNMTANEAAMTKAWLNEEINTIRERLAAESTGVLPAQIQAIRESLKNFRNQDGGGFTQEQIDHYLNLMLSGAAIAAKRQDVSVEDWLSANGVNVNVNTKAVFAPDGKSIWIIPEGQPSPQELYAKDMAEQREFMRQKMLENPNFTDEDFQRWAEEWRAAHPRFDKNGKQLFQEAPESSNRSPRVGLEFKDFFRKVTSGLFGKSKIPFVPELIDLSKDKKIIEEMHKYIGNFDDHIFKSIPAFYELKVRTIKGFLTLPKGSKVLDIAASEGSFGKTISALSKGKIETVSLDPNRAMKKTFDDLPQAPGAAFAAEAFLNGFRDEEDGVTYNAHNPDVKYDAIHESMGFQFIDPDRTAQIAEVVRLLKDDGLFVTSEKLLNPDWEKNEKFKDQEHKNKYFTEEEQKQKAEKVGFSQSKQDEQTVGMVDNMVQRQEFEKLLAQNFRYVAQYWDSGNFQGYVASNSFEKVDKFLKAAGDLNNKFSTGPLVHYVSGDPVVRRGQVVSTTGAETQEGSPAFTDFKAVFGAKRFVDSLVGALLEGYPQLGGKATELELLGLKSDKEDEKLKEKKKQIRKELVGKMTDKEKEGLIKKFVERIEDNLIWLYNKTPKDFREKSSRWYVGANRLANELAEKYGITIEQSSAIIAVLSPRTAWDLNIGQAIWVMRVMTDPTAVVTQNLIDSFYAGLEDSVTDGEKPLADKDALAGLIGKPINEIENLDHQAWMLRAYVESQDRSYHIYDPTGTPVGKAIDKEGKLSELAWNSYGNTKKAIEIFKGADIEKISDLLGGAHKIRNFYNNIVDPTNAESVTIDTHAIAAALFAPLSQKSKPANDVFSGPSNTELGLKGLYILYDEGYKRAASKLGITSRELQSIVWEAARSVFTDTLKRDKALVEKVSAEWAEFQNGGQSLEETREKIFKLVDGFKQNPRNWVSDTDVKENDIAAGVNIRLESENGEARTKSGLSSLQAQQLIEREFGAIARKLKAGLSQNYIGHDASYIYSGRQGSHYIEFNPSALANDYTIDEIRAAMREEIVHAAIGQVLRKRGLSWTQFHENVAKLMTKDEKAALKKVYTSLSLKDHVGVGAEFVRLIIQKQLYHVATEEASGKSRAVKYVLKAVAQAHNFLRRLKADSSAEAQQIRAVMNEAVDIIRSADKTLQSSPGRILFQSENDPSAQNGGSQVLASLPLPEKQLYFASELRNQAQATLAALPVLDANQIAQIVGGAKLEQPGGSEVMGLWRTPTGIVKALDFDSALHLEDLIITGYGGLAADIYDSSSNTPEETKLRLVERYLLLNSMNSGTPTQLLGMTDIYGPPTLLISQPEMFGVPNWYDADVNDVIDKLLENKKAVKITNFRSLLLNADSTAQTYVVQIPSGAYVLVSDLRGPNAGYTGLDRKDAKTFDPIIRMLTPGELKIPEIAAAVNEIETKQQNNAYFQNEDRGPRVNGAIEFNPGNVTIHLFKTANLSTLLHELGHLFVGELERQVRAGFGGPKALAELNTLRAFVGALDPSKELTTEQHEKLARAFESYLREGRAPTIGLARAFHSFRTWLTAVYRGSSILDIEMSQEVKEVFDRLLAAEEEIAQAEQFYGNRDRLLALIAVENDEEKLKQKLEDARRSELEHQTSIRLKAYIRALGGLSKIKTEQTAQVESLPVYQAIEKAKAQGGISAGSIAALLGDSAVEVLANKYPNLITDDGLDISGLAFDVGLTSGEQLAEQLRDAVPISEAINAAVKQELRRVEESIRNDISKSPITEADEALHSDKSLEYLIAETELLRSKLKRKSVRPRLFAEAYTQAAEEFLGSLKFSDSINYSRFLNQEKRLGAEVLAAARKGDWDRAYQLREKQLLYHAIVRASIKARKYRENLERRYSKSKVNSLLDKIEMAYRPVVQTLLSRYGLLQFDGAEFNLSDLRELDEDGGLDALMPDWIKQKQNIGGYRNLTLSQVRELDETIKSIVAYGRDAMTSLKESEAKTLSEFVQSSVERMQKLKDAKTAQRGDWNYPLIQFAHQIKAGVQMAQFVADIADGFTNLKEGKQGPLRKLYQRLVTAELEQSKLVDTVLKASEPAWQVLHQAVLRIEKEMGGKYFDIDGLELPHAMVREGKGKWTGEMVVSALLNCGNQGNLTALREGYNLPEDAADRLAALLTAEELYAIQKIWDATDLLFEPINQTHIKIYNREIKKVQADPLVLRSKDGAGVNLRGGYYPLIFDHEINARAGRFNEEDLMKNKAAAVFRSVTPNSGFAKTRQGTSLPPELSLNVWINHVIDASRYAMLAPVIRDWNRVSTKEEWRETYLDKFGRESYNALRDWVKYQAVPKRMQTESWVRGLDKAADWLRARSSYALLGYKLVSGLAQRTALLNSAVALGGWKWIGIGYSAVAQKGLGTALIGTTNTDAWSAIIGKSEYMRKREDNIDREIRDIVSRIQLGKKVFTIAGREFTVSNVRDLAFEWMKMNDRAVVSVVWSGAYQKYLQTLADESMTLEQREKAAVEYADTVVQDTQPSALKAEMSSAARAEGWVRLFTMLMTWSFKFGNRLFYYGKAYSEGAVSTKNYIRHITYEVFMESWLRTLLYSAIAGTAPEWWRFLVGPIENLIQWIPIIRDIPGTLATKGQLLDLNRSPYMEGFRRISKLIKSADPEKLQEDDGVSRFAMDLFRATAFVTGTPIDNIVNDIRRFTDRKD